MPSKMNSGCVSGRANPLSPLPHASEATGVERYTDERHSASTMAISAAHTILLVFVLLLSRLLKR